jgi:hypothetical protein
MTAPTPPQAPQSAPTAPGAQGPQAEITEAEAAKMIDWHKAELASGKITQEQANKIFDQLNASPEQRLPDSRSDELILLNKQFPPAKGSEYRIQYYTPGQEPPVIPKEVQAFDANARGWMSDAVLPRELGNSLVNTLSKAIQHTHAMSAEQRETYKDAENLKMEKLFGPDWHDKKLKPVAVMIHELDQKRSGLKELVRAHGDHAMFIAQLIQAATIYHERRKAQGK